MLIDLPDHHPVCKYRKIPHLLFQHLDGISMPETVQFEENNKFLCFHVYNRKNQMFFTNKQRENKKS